MGTVDLLIVCGSLKSGGAERVISILSSPFADAFNQVTIITWRNEPIFYKIDNRVVIKSLPKLAGSNKSLKKIRHFRRYIKANRPNIILSFLTIFNLLTLLSLIGVNIPIIVAERNDPRFVKGGIFVKLIRNILYLKADGILCQTESIRQYFKGFLRKKTKIIYNPITLSEESIGKALKTKKKPRIVSVGRLHPQKNQKLLIDSFCLFHKSHPSYTLSIYGTGILKENLEKYISDISMSDFIQLPGEQKHITEIILDAEAFVMTSDYEGMPNALIEAMCLGLPCISTKVSGAVDLIENNKNGILIDRDASDISKAICLIVDNNDIATTLASKSSIIFNQLKTETISKTWIDYINSKIR
ncbi:MAG: glycosyltransferase [Ruminococcus sp.]|nr:glycosyltransferase [Ruminococcus sp.]